MKANKELKRVNPDIHCGLGDSEVNERIKADAINKKNKVKGKSHLMIVLSSFFTFFNVVLYLLSVVLVLFQRLYTDGIKYIPITKFGFLFVIFCNAITSIISQEASKHTVEKMKLIVNPNARVVRNNEEKDIKVDEIVLDDVVIIQSGNEIPCDLEVINGEISVNESMLTGESKAIIKGKGETLLSGSYCISGKCYAKAIKVGNDTYASSLQSKISSIKKKKSVLLVNINKIIKVLLCFIFPAALIVGLKTYYVGVDGENWVFSLNVITKISVTIVGMIPIGMILLSSITLSRSIIKLYKKQTMVQELYAIENLSRINVLCLDKTGTLTRQNFSVKEVISLKNEDIDEIMRLYLSNSTDVNRTSKALKDYYEISENADSKLHFEPFDSEKKYSSLNVSNELTYKLGAPEYIFKNKEALEKVKGYSLEGYRVLGLTKNDDPIAIFVIEDELRKGIKDTLNYFYDLDIDIKIISGDNPLTVTNIASKAGVRNASKYISLENVDISEIKNLVNDYSIFGRVSPDKKEEIIKCLQNEGKMVGYVGDGVNDTQSLREANCSIALKSGDDSTKAVSDCVLLDDDFSHLPDVLKEGRRAVANIERSMMLFLTKSVFIGLISIFSVFFKNGMPIEIESIYIYEFVTVALCGLLLSIENNKPRASEEDFVKKVLTRSFTFGFFMFIGALIPLIASTFVEMEHLDTIITLDITIAGLVILYFVCKPFSKYSLVVFIIGCVLTLLCLLVLPSCFIDGSYFHGVSSIKEQIQLIIGAIGNLTIYKEISFSEYMVFMAYLILCIPSYYFSKIVLKFLSELASKINGVCLRHQK